MKDSGMPRFESTFVEAIVNSFNGGNTPWGVMPYFQEFEYGTGRTDIVALTSIDGLIAFEAKLFRWRDALYQAYRNRAFAHCSYVAVPEMIASKAMLYPQVFEKYGVGLSTLENNTLKVIIPACKERPIQEWLSNRALAELARSTNDHHAAPRSDCFENLRLCWS